VGVLSLGTSRHEAPFDELPADLLDQGVFKFGAVRSSQREHRGRGLAR